MSMPNSCRGQIIDYLCELSASFVTNIDVINIIAKYVFKSSPYQFY